MSRPKYWPWWGTLVGWLDDRTQRVNLASILEQSTWWGKLASRLSESTWCGEMVSRLGAATWWVDLKTDLDGALWWGDLMSELKESTLWAYSNTRLGDMTWWAGLASQPGVRTWTVNIFQAFYKTVHMPCIWYEILHASCTLSSGWWWITESDLKRWRQKTHNQIQNEIGLQMDCGNLILLILHACLPGQSQLKTYMLYMF